MADSKKKLTMKKKGGTMFPKYNLKQVRASIKPLVSKTHLDAITIEQLNSGVFGVGANSDKGKVKYSAMKQFKLVDGPYGAIRASELAQNINSATGLEATQYLQTAFFNVKVFKNTFDTFHSAKTAKSQILGYVTKTLRVHPDSGDVFLDSFLASAIEAGLGRLSGDEVELFSAIPLDAITLGVEKDGEDSDDELEATVQEEDQDGQTEQDGIENGTLKGSEGPKKSSVIGRPNIDIKIDPSLDPDKLEKQLAVLRKFKLI